MTDTERTKLGLAIEEGLREVVEMRRIITVDIGRSTWQGYEGDEPRVGTLLEHQVWDAETGDVITLTERIPEPRRLNIINLGEGL